MAARNSLEAKRTRRVRKLFRKELPAYIDLVQYLQDRGYADTGGVARGMLIAGVVKADSHVIGRIETPQGTFAQPAVPADMRPYITVSL